MIYFYVLECESDKLSLRKGENSVRLLKQYKDKPCKRLQLVIPNVRLLRRVVIPKVRYSYGPLFLRYVIPKVRFSENEIGLRFVNPKMK